MEMKYRSKAIFRKNSLPIRVGSFQSRGSRKLQSLFPILSNKSQRLRHRGSALPGYFFFQGSRVCRVKLHTETHGEWRLGCREKEVPVRKTLPGRGLGSPPHWDAQVSEPSEENLHVFRANFHLEQWKIPKTHCKWEVSSHPPQG